MAYQYDKNEINSPSASIILRILEALPYGVSWAKLPGGEIQFCNAEFINLFGYGESHFRTAEQFISSLVLHEQQQNAVRDRWLNFEIPAGRNVHVVEDMELDVVAKDGAIRTVLHSGLMLPDDQLAVAIFKDFSPVQSNGRLLQLANRDDLTGVANRRGLRERWRLETRIDPKRRLAFLMMDLDDFKPINDAHGHTVGDAVLQIIAQRLVCAVRTVDLVCRLGGDEFGVLLVEPGDRADIEQTCERILQSLRIPIQVAAQNLSVGASIGGCLYPDQATDKRDLIHRADLALYQIKKSGKKGTWGWFEDDVLAKPAPLTE